MRFFMILFCLLTSFVGAKEPKLLVLIIASDDKPAYKDLKNVWKTYMNSNPNVEAYFIAGDPNLAENYAIKDNTLYVKTEEGLKPGIVNKTVLSLEALLPRMDEFDYVLRTNLSSFYVFPRLLKVLETLPKEKCYASVPLYLSADRVPEYGEIRFGSGAGFVLSKDLAKTLVKDKAEIFALSSQLPDDVLIGLFYQRRNIPIIPLERIDVPTYNDWLNQKEYVSKNAFHIRAKSHYDIRRADENFSDEKKVLNDLLEMFYKPEKESIHA